LNIEKEIICLICCRGGSKTIKNKNIKKFNGKPLLIWSLENIKKSKIFDRIILSTDSSKIVKIAKKIKGLEIPGLRPKELATSNSNQFQTHNYIFKKLKINNDNAVACVFNNNPFINVNLIKKSYQIFKKQNFKGLVTDAARVDGDYLAWKQCKKKGTSLNYIFKKRFLSIKLNRQKLTPAYVNIFNLRWGKPSFLASYNSYKRQLMRGDNSFIELKKKENFDIDDQEDWQISETIHKKYYCD
jgi:CMP-N-acetylneuraminic acid synthetase